MALITVFAIPVSTQGEDWPERSGIEPAHAGLLLAGDPRVAVHKDPAPAAIPAVERKRHTHCPGEAGRSRSQDKRGDCEKERPGTGASKTEIRAARLDSLPENPTKRDQIAQWVYALAPDFNLDPELVLVVIAVESAFNVNAISPKDARGLMQLIPATAQRFGVENIMDPVDNLRGGMAYLQWLLNHFDGNLELALAGYNAGEGAVRRYRGIPPFAETRAYVEKITTVYGQVTMASTD